MTETKSKGYNISDDVVSFITVDKKFRGMSIKNSNNLFVPEDNTSSKFNTFKDTPESLDAFNKAVYGSSKESYVSLIEEASSEEQSQYFAQANKKFNNEQFVEEQRESTNLAFVGVADAVTNNSGGANSYRYPFDLDLNQDHLKISRYNYVRPNLNLSKSANRDNVDDKSKPGFQALEASTVAGDSVLGSDLKTIIHLPMPKVTDVNGVEWGKSELNSSGLAALNITNALTFGGALSGKDKNEDEKEIREAIASRREKNSGREGAAVLYTGTIAKIAGAVTGSDLDTDTFLARQGGKVLNPNAEMLFQGPVIRDFGFSFIMIARSEEEGKMIRNIIRDFKLAMAPKFRSTTFLESPDVFMLDYRNESGSLETVNRFSPGGLALTTMRVDYAPNGYWAAYRDSQPVAIKMDLDFTELRPIYEGDQIQTPENSVGY